MWRWKCNKVWWQRWGEVWYTTAYNLLLWHRPPQRKKEKKSLAIRFHCNEFRLGGTGFMRTFVGDRFQLKPGTNPHFLWGAGGGSAYDGLVVHTWMNLPPCLAPLLEATHTKFKGVSGCLKSVPGSINVLAPDIPLPMPYDSITTVLVFASIMWGEVSCITVHG